ncbi:MAG TPA: diaminopimelate epimerase [Frankiaceae bacterium]|nr:diaminopimelate epimerase [Frankiaceae bacterium]
MRFTKGHGTANDFVLVPDPDGDLALTDAFVRAVCDRRTGVGGDGILRVVRTRHVPGYEHLGAEWFMDYRNADGGAVEMCGNGVRVFARYLASRGWAAGDAIPVGTRDGVKHVTLRADGRATVDMGEPGFAGAAPDGATFVSMGNPHVVFFVDDVATAPVRSEGPRIEAATPGGTNVEYAVVRDRGRLVMRVWERGVGETMSCGTGACAVAVAAARNGLAERSVEVEVPGGELSVEWTPEGRVLLTGPAVLVADGDLRDEWLALAR